MKNFYVYYSYEEWGRGYIGKRECLCLPEEDVKYFGSFKDKTFKPTQKIILAIFSSKQDAIEAEIALHELYKVDTNPDFANKAKQKTVKFSYDRTGETNGERWHETMSGENSPTKRAEVREKIRKAQLRLGDNHPSRRPEGRERARQVLTGDKNPNRSPEGRERCRKNMLHPVRSQLQSEILSKVLSQLWIDPDHPELGSQNAGNLVQMQRRLGLPSEKKNRVKLGINPCG